MGQLTKLGPVIDNLPEFDSRDTIYATEPWTEQSRAMVARESVDGKLPPEASDLYMKYFMEIGIAREFIEDWLASQVDKPTRTAIYNRLIDYAIDDA